MSIDSVRWFGRVVNSCVPNHELLIVSDGSEERFMEQVPSYVLNDGGVTGKDVLGVDDAEFLRGCVDVPQADGVVVAG